MVAKRKKAGLRIQPRTRRTQPATAARCFKAETAAIGRHWLKTRSKIPAVLRKKERAAVLRGFGKHPLMPAPSALYYSLAALILQHASHSRVICCPLCGVLSERRRDFCCSVPAMSFWAGVQAQLSYSWFDFFLWLFFVFCCVYHVSAPLERRHRARRGTVKTLSAAIRQGPSLRSAPVTPRVTGGLTGCGHDQRANADANVRIRRSGGRLSGAGGQTGPQVGPPKGWREGFRVIVGGVNVTKKKKKNAAGLVHFI